MGYRLGCPGCQAGFTYNLYSAYRAGENCPYCGGPLSIPEIEDD